MQIQMQNREIQMIGMQKCRNTNYRLTEIQGKQKLIHDSKVTQNSKVTYNSYLRNKLWVIMKYG